MKPTRWYIPRAAAAVTLAAVTVLACTDRSNPVAPGDGGEPPGPEPSRPIELAELRCTAVVATRAVTCAAPQAPAGGGQGDILYGGQNEFVLVQSSNVNWDGASHKFTFDVTVRNLIRQSIGTVDGVTADPTGVKVFFSQQPTVTDGSGVITIDNADGTGTFTAAGQPYYAYVQRIDPFAVSSPKTWQFDVPATVNAFAFVLFIASPVQFPTGWIDVSHPTYSLRRTTTKLITATVRDQFGRVIPDAIVTWSSSDETRATVPVDSGLVTGHLTGPVDIIASSTNDVTGTPGATQTGAAHFTITGTALVWTAGAGSTDWNAPGNWDLGVSPVAEDSATIPVVGSALYPSLTANQSIGRVIVDDGAQLNLNAFDLTASQDAVSAPTSGTGGIFSTGGRMIMTGIAKSTSGRMPRMTVTGTYSLTGNVNADAPLRVQGGRLRNTAFRIRVVSQ